MIAHLHANRAAFDDLVRRIQLDPNIRRIDDTWCDGISDTKKLEEFRKAFRQLGVPRGIYSSDGGRTIEFIENTIGISVTGSTKGYAYSEKRPDLVVADLDLKFKTRTSSFEAFRHVVGKWYLFLSWTD